VTLINRFIAFRPFAYHVTQGPNLTGVARARKLFPAADLIRRSGETHLLGTRREKARPITVEGQTYVLQDQKPLIFANAELQAGWREADFVEFLDQHVFFWPGVDSGPIKYGARLLDHYEGERPAVLRVGVVELFDANLELTPLFCAFNSGAPRMQGSRRGARGPDLFLPAHRFPRPAGKAIELVFRGGVNLPSGAEFRTVEGTWVPLESAV
jgi:hypothetical protein